MSLPLPESEVEQEMTRSGGEPLDAVKSGRGNSSYGQILRATSIVGGGKVLTILVGLVRSKALALLLGPAGVGMMGLLQGVMSTGTTLFGLGMGSSGVRQIAAAEGDPVKLSTVRKALWRSNFVLGLLGLVVLWLFSEPISRLVFGEVGRATDVAWMGVGVLISLIAASQMALLQGMRRIENMVKAGLVGASLGTLAGILIVWWLGEEGIRWFVLASPFFSVLGAAWFARKLPQIESAKALTQTLWEQWREMASLGTYLMMTALASGLTALAVRAILTRELGVNAAGHFQAATAISSQYLSLVLGAMAADYYPRLTGLVGDRDALNDAVNDQLEIALLLVAPILIAVLALAPWVLTVFYSTEFQAATGILRWNILGDALKVASWPIAFIVLAAGDGRLYIFTEISIHIVFVGFILTLLPVLGLESAGVAFWAQYLYYFPMVWWIGKRRYGFEMRKAGWTYLGGIFGAAALITVSAEYSDLVASVAGIILALAAGMVALRSINYRTGLIDRLLDKYV